MLKIVKAEYLAQEQKLKLDEPLAGIADHARVQVSLSAVQTPDSQPWLDLKSLPKEAIAEWRSSLAALPMSGNERRVSGTRGKPGVRAQRATPGPEDPEKLLPRQWQWPFISENRGAVRRFEDHEFVASNGFQPALHRQCERFATRPDTPS